jgi:hypothetical protein
VFKNENITIENGFPLMKFMKSIIAILLWCILLVMCWPIALILIFVMPILWLILLPFRIVGFTIEVVFKFIGAVLMFPFRVLGGR